jgi:superkiller protein 3
MHGAGEGKETQFILDKMKQGKDINEWNETLAIMGICRGHLKEGDLTFNAARDFARAEPNNPRALATFAMVLAYLDKKDVSLKLAQKALELDPKSARALAAQAYAVGSQGAEQELAKELISKAVKLAPKDREVNYAAYRLYQKFLEDMKAEEALTRIIKNSPNDATAYYQRAWYYKDLRDRNSSIEDCKKAIAINPYYEPALALLGRMLHHVERYQEAIKAYGQLEVAEKRKGGKSIGTVNFMRRASCYAALNQHQKAIDDYSIVLKNMSPDHDEKVFSKTALHMNKRSKEDYIQSWSARSQLYAKAGQLDRAIKDSTSLLAVFPKNPTGLHERSKQLQKAGKYEQALKDVEVLISIDPDVALWYRTKVDILKKMGRIEEAKRFERETSSLEKFGIK